MSRVASKPRGGMGRRKKATPPKKECDRLFSLIVRARGACEECGSKEGLQTAHGFSRSYHAVRWDERNAWALCRRHHMYWTHRPLEWTEWMMLRLGPDLYTALRFRAMADGKTDYKTVLADLRERARKLGVA